MLTSHVLVLPRSPTGCAETNTLGKGKPLRSPRCIPSRPRGLSRPLRNPRPGVAVRLPTVAGWHQKGSGKGRACPCGILPNRPPFGCLSEGSLAALPNLPSARLSRPTPRPAPRAGQRFKPEDSPASQRAKYQLSPLPFRGSTGEKSVASADRLK